MGGGLTDQALTLGFNSVLITHQGLELFDGKSLLQFYQMGHQLAQELPFSVVYLSGNIEGHKIGWNLVREEHLILEIL